MTNIDCRTCSTCANPRQPETQERGVRPWNYSWVMLGQCARMDAEISRSEYGFYTRRKVIRDVAGIYKSTPPTNYYKLTLVDNIDHVSDINMLKHCINISIIKTCIIHPIYETDKTIYCLRNEKCELYEL